ncbi:hypothetical protein LBMAG52_45790 [Planctomycetia bacterium]|jgi:hypothetical protein|nr:hypothetical protein LBMAG52_45790 [Planctomycetia bacterium]
MSRFDLVSKQDVWLRRIQRFSQSRLTVAEFCDRERVSVAAFYQWRRKLVTLVNPPHATARAQDGLPLPPSSGAPNGFVPVRVLSSSTIEVRFPNGVVLILPAGDLEVLRQTLSMVSQIPVPVRPVTEGRRC